MRIYQQFTTGVIILIILCFIIVLTSAENTQTIPEGILLSATDLMPEQYDELISVTDIFSQISRSSDMVDVPNISMQLYDMKPGGILAPDTILPIPNVVYIIKGTATISADDDLIQGNEGDAIYIPEEKNRRIENAGDSDLVFYSILDWDDVTQYLNQTSRNTTEKSEYMNTIQVISEENTTPVFFGNESSDEGFFFYRLIHPDLKPYNITYDLGTVEIKNNSEIPEHYVDKSLQFLTVLSGNGNISVGCKEYTLSMGDSISIAPGALMNVTATEGMHLMMLTWPYYLSEHDHAISGACITRISNDTDENLKNPESSAENSEEQSDR